MQRIRDIILLCIVLMLISFGCQSNKINEEILIIREVYKSIPKFIPAPPDSNQINKPNQVRGIKHNYAINANFSNNGIDYKPGTVFYKHKSKKIFEKVELDSIEEKLVGELKKPISAGTIDENQLQKCLKERIIFLNKNTITKKDEQNYNINRILTFSKPVLNDAKNMAVLYVINYGAKLDSSLTVYFLHKRNQNWIIKYRKQILVS